MNCRQIDVRVNIWYLLLQFFLVTEYTKYKRFILPFPFSQNLCLTGYAPTEAWQQCIRKATNPNKYRPHPVCVSDRQEHKYINPFSSFVQWVRYPRHTRCFALLRVASRCFALLRVASRCFAFFFVPPQRPEKDVKRGKTLSLKYRNEVSAQ